MKRLLYVGGGLDGQEETYALGSVSEDKFGAYRRVTLRLNDGLCFQFMAHSSLGTSVEMIDALLEGYRRPLAKAEPKNVLALLVGGPHGGLGEWVDSLTNTLLKGKDRYHSTPLRVSDGTGPLVVFAHESLPDAWAVMQAIIDGGYVKLVNPKRPQVDDPPCCICGRDRAEHNIRSTYGSNGIVVNLERHPSFHYYERSK
jgi:hypothetical protein